MGEGAGPFALIGWCFGGCWKGEWPPLKAAMAGKWGTAATIRPIGQRARLEERAPIGCWDGGRRGGER